MTYLITEEKNKRLPRQRNKNMKIIGSMNTWSDLLRRKVKRENKPTSRTSECRQRLVLRMEFMVCIVFI